MNDITKEANEYFGKNNSQKFKYIKVNINFVKICNGTCVLLLFIIPNEFTHPFVLQTIYIQKQLMFLFFIQIF